MLSVNFDARIDRPQKDADEEVKTGRPDVSREVQQVADEQIRMRIAALPFFETVKIEELFFPGRRRAREDLLHSRTGNRK